MNGPGDARTPPRFVPTLTEVVDVPDWLLAKAPVSEAYEPTPPEPTEPPLVFDFPADSAAIVSPPAPPPPTTEALDAWADLITQRVLEQLEHRLPTLIQDQVADMASRLAEGVSQQLRGQLPTMVHEAVRASLSAMGDISAGDQQRGFSAMGVADVDPG